MPVGATGPQPLTRIWLPFALAYFLCNALRNINAVLVPELTAEFALTASQLGLLTSVFYIGFSIMQLPAGILLDRYGSRRVHATLMIVAAAGCILHATGDGFLAIALGRAFIGVGLAVGLMSAAKSIAQWFALPRVPLALNMLMAVGGLGAIVAAGPVGWSLDYVPWRVVFAAAAGLLLLASALLYFVAPDRHEAGSQQSLASLAAGFGVVFANGTFWRLGLMMAVMSGANTAMQSLWIGPWLRDVGGYDRPQSLVLMTWLALAAVAGYIVAGTACDWLIRRGARALTLYKIQCCIVIALFALIALAGKEALPLWFAYFAMGSGGPLVLAMLARRFTPEFTGRVNTASNVLLFSLAFLFQWGVGVALDLWPVIDGHYAAEGYRAAVAVLVVLHIAMFVVLAVGEKPKTAIGVPDAGGLVG